MAQHITLRFAAEFLAWLGCDSGVGSVDLGAAVEAVINVTIEE